MDREILEFIARDRTGRVYELLRIRTPPRPQRGRLGSDGTAHYDAPSAELKTRDGQPVERLERGRYRLVKTGEELESDDPKAP